VVFDYDKLVAGGQVSGGSVNPPTVPLGGCVVYPKKPFADSPLFGEGVLEALISGAIGYDLVPISVVGHPGLRWTFRTGEDRDLLVLRIAEALRGAV